MNDFRAGLVATLLGCFAAGCAPSEEEVSDSCGSVTECDLSQVCDLAAGKCVPIPRDRFLGKFSCFVTASGEKDPYLAVSEVVGNMSGDDWSLPVAECSMHEFPQINLKLLNVSLLHEGFERSLRLEVDWNPAAAGQGVDLVQANANFTTNSAHFASSTENRVYGWSAAGFFIPLNNAVIGEWFEAYVDVTMKPPVDVPVVFGVPCPGGAADCGYSLDTALHGLCDSVWDGGPNVCSMYCESDAQCAPGGGICFSNVCLRPCVGLGDPACIAPLTCVHDDSTGRQACL